MHPRKWVLRRAPDTRHFLDGLAEACGLVLASGQGLTQAERDLFYEVRKGKHEFVTVRRMLDAAATCSKLGAVTAIPEAFRLYALSLLPTVSLCERETYAHNTLAQARGDVAQAALMRDPSRSTRDAALFDLTEEYETLRVHRDAILWTAAKHAHRIA